MQELDPDIKDGLTEIINIGTGMAAHSLCQLLGSEVILNVPEVRIISNADAASMVLEQTSSESVSSVSMQFSGPLKGKAFLMFSETDTSKLTRAYIGEELSTPALQELEQEVVLEMGNIILNSCLAGLSNILGGEYITDLPYYYRGPVQRAFGNGEGSDDFSVLFIKVHFDVREIGVTGFVALVMGVNAMTELVAKVDEYIKSLDS